MHIHLHLSIGGGSDLGRGLNHKPMSDGLNGLVVFSANGSLGQDGR
jgi:hypothetical protein